MTPEELAALHAQCFDTTPRPWTAAEFEDLLKLPETSLLVRDGGFAVMRMAGPEAELLTLAVDPEKRRRGTGSELVSDVLRTAVAKGAEEVFLEVSETNAPARALYEKKGFATAGHRKDYYASPRGEKVTAIVMRCPVGTGE
jgi:[ribosomal protein S18]-alanine N-acetyltransferase